MKWFPKTLLFNILFLVVLLAIFECIAYKKACDYYGYTNGRLKYNIDLAKADKVFYDLLQTDLRKPVGLNYTKKPVLIFGCSYMYGFLLNDTQTFSYKLSHLTKRPVYNRALSGTGIQHMYKQLSSEDYLPDTIPQPEYIICGFSYFLHSVRLIQYNFQVFDNHFYLRYYPRRLDKNGNMIERKPFLPRYLNGLYLVRILEEMNVNRLHAKQGKTRFFEDFIFLTFHKSKEQVKKRYPNAKFVIYCFDIYKGDTTGHPELLQRLKDDGFIIINQADISDIDLTNSKWWVTPDDSHPNEKYWDEITPKIAKILKL